MTDTSLNDLVLDADDVAVVQELLDGLVLVSLDNLKALLEQSKALSAPQLAHITDLAQLRSMVAAHVLRVGVARVLNFVPKPLLRTITEAAHASSGSSSSTSSAGNKHEVERTMGRTLRRFINERLDVASLRALSVALGVDGLSREAAREASQREQQIADEVMLMGTEGVLLAVNVALLRVLAKELQLDVAPGQSQEALADTLMATLFNLEPLDKKKLERKQRLREEEQEKRERAGRKVKRGKSRYKAPPLSNIKKGITKQELHDLYNFTDLQEYCKEHELDYTGKKALLMRRIISFLETGDRGAVKVPRKRKLH